MTRLKPWVGREFQFEALSPELNLNLRVRMRGLPARVEQLIRAVDPERLTARPDEKWSIQEHIGHLIDLESLFEGRLDQYLAGATVLTAADMSNRRTEDAGHNAQPIGQLVTRMRTTRDALVARLDGIEPEVFARVAKHERLGVDMRLIDSMAFQSEHDDHHVARIWELAQ